MNLDQSHMRKRTLVHKQEKAKEKLRAPQNKAVSNLLSRLDQQLQSTQSLTTESPHRVSRSFNLVDAATNLSARLGPTITEKIKPLT